ncbi:hypothetical protein SDC9_106592 [bioreactor metagenome]|uniref:Uncharacterized protein n=1 Tax=bioreactor metagenome TaxID=1076179 RepID=A0A645B3V7_9ZZZZ
MAVERQTRFQAQRIARAEADGLCAALKQFVPEKHRVFAQNEHLVADGFARVASLGEMRRTPAELDRTQRVFHRLGERFSVRHIVEQFLRFRPLHGDERYGFALVLNLCVKAFDRGG